jgi:microcystin-dependent protein
LAQLSVAGSFTYIAGAASLPLAANSITPAGGNQPHDNFMPYLCLNYIIALFGIYPSPN